jgi:hypothetical protein
MVPRMPDTVLMAAPSNLAASSWLLNMPPMKAVWRCTLKGVPTCAGQGWGRLREAEAEARRTDAAGVQPASRLQQRLQQQLWALLSAGPFFPCPGLP